MRRAVLATLGTVIGLVLLLGFKSQPPAGIGAARPALSKPAPAPSGTGTATRARHHRAARAASTRTVTGGTADTPYGPVQVQVTVTGQRITAVRPLQLPNDQQRSIEIADQAVPVLVRETLAAQSSRIDMVSGATYTSQGYASSLQSALDKAGLG